MRVVRSAPRYSVADPALAAFLGLGNQSEAGLAVTEASALGVTAVYRSVRLIADTVAALPMKSYRNTDAGGRERVGSIFDNPGGALLTPYAWKHLVVTYLALHGAAPLLHVYNGASALDSLLPIHPSAVAVEFDREANARRFKVTSDGQTRTYGEAELTYITTASLDGICGASPISLCRNAIGTGMAGDKAAARMFSSGMLIGGLVTPKEDLGEDEAEAFISGLRAKLTGTQNAGDIAIVSTMADFTPWTMNADDAQFLQTRQYGVEEIARIFGVPKELLSASGATSWGSGIQELVRGFARFTLPGYTTPMEEAFSRLLSNPRFVEFDYAGLLQGTPADEIDLLLRQIDGGLLTVDEARAIRNLPPLNPPAAPAGQES